MMSRIPSEFMDLPSRAVQASHPFAVPYMEEHYEERGHTKKRRRRLIRKSVGHALRKR